MLVGYRCPPGGEAPGRKNPVHYCLGECKTQCVAPPLLAAMYKADVGNYHNNVDYVSASMLAGNNCARQVRWERTEDFHDLPLKRFWPFRGTHAHSICEGAHDLIAEYGWFQEIRTTVTFDYPDLPAPIFETTERPLTDAEFAAAEKRAYTTALVDVLEFASERGTHLDAAEADAWARRIMQPVPRTETRVEFTGDFDPKQILQIKLRGTADAYNPYTRQLADMKSMADAKAQMVITGSKGGTFSKNLEDAHVWQFSIYRLLLARSRVPDWVRERAKLFGLPEIKGKNFPAPRELIMQGIGMMNIPRSGGTYPLKERYGQVTLYDIDPVPILPLHEIEAFVRPRLLYWYRALSLGIPVPVVEKDRAWLCRGCAFNGEVIEGERCFPDAERKAKAAQV